MDPHPLWQHMAQQCLLPLRILLVYSAGGQMALTIEIVARMERKESEIGR